jgi:diguanylate cyclase (GGDEF)-like protein
VLNKIITLTSERDLVSLEHLLAASLYELISPTNIGVANTIKIYHAKDLERQIFTTKDSDRNPDGEKLSRAFKNELSKCFQLGKDSLFQEKNAAPLSLYALKNSKSDTIAVIAIEAAIEDEDLRHTITMVLHVYQNFASLIRDNEHDTLTGLLNRKTFESKINKVMSLLQREKSRKEDKQDNRFYLAVLDIDHFKKINDLHGHLIGDEVLVLFARMMAETFREKDMLFRYGGEEFVGVYQCACDADIKLALERFRKKIANFTFPQVGKVTVSIGYTQIKEFDTCGLMIGRADQALYHAKNTGRNRIFNYENLVSLGVLQDSTKEGDVVLF